MPNKESYPEWINNLQNALNRTGFSGPDLLEWLATIIVLSAIALFFLYPLFYRRSYRVRRFGYRLRQHLSRMRRFPLFPLFSKRGKKQNAPPTPPRPAANPPANAGYRPTPRPPAKPDYPKPRKTPEPHFTRPTYWRGQRIDGNHNPTTPKGTSHTPERKPAECLTCLDTGMISRGYDGRRIRCPQLCANSKFPYSKPDK